MSDTLLIIGGFSLLLVPVFLLIFIIQTIRHKSQKIWGCVALVSLLSFIVFETIGIKLACDHNYVLISEIESTCEEKGAKKYYCDKCEKEKTQIIPAKKHELIEISRQEATISSKGEIVYACTRCNHQENEIIKKLPRSKCPHNWTDATCTTPKKCSDCGKKDGKALGHNMMVTDKEEPTYTQDGKLFYTCSRCGKSETEKVPQLKCSHQWEEANGIKRCIICGETEKDKTSKTTTPSTSKSEDQSIIESTTSSSTESSQTSLIQVSFELDYIDGNRLHITVFTKNNSEQIFNGNVHVIFYSRDGKTRLGSDAIFVENLFPGQESWAKITVDAYHETPKMEATFSEVSFAQPSVITSSIDSSATEKTKSSYYWSFYETSWYDDITDIVVYTDGNCIVSVKSSTKENGQFYAATIWGCGKDYGVTSVRVVDPDGKVLSIFTK